MDAGDDIDFSELDLDIGNGNDHLITSGCSMSDSFFAGVCEDTAEHTTCTHTHICVPPVDDPSHPHTCVHIHAHAAAAPPPDAASPSGSSKKPPSVGTGNRAAVKKFRNKKKAHAASLEQQVHILTVVNQQVTAQNQQLTARVAALEADKRLRDAELTRVRCLLVEFRGRIDGEIGAAAAFPIQNHQIQRPVSNIDLPQAPPSVDHGAFLGISSRGSCDFRCNPGPGIMMMQGTSSAQVVFGQQGACGGANIQRIGSTNLPVCCEGMMDTGPSGCNIQNAENN